MQLLRPLLYVWTLPNTLLGLICAVGALMTGGRVQVVRGVVEVHGGPVTKLLRRGLPWVGAGAAMTLGHVILGCDEHCLDATREHEHIHVRQYEVWRPLFIPAYLLASLLARLRGGDPYRDNPLEREAFKKTGA